MKNETNEVRCAFKFSSAVRSALNRAAYQVAQAHFQRERDTLIERLVEHVRDSDQFTDGELIGLLEQTVTEAVDRLEAGDE